MQPDVHQRTKWELQDIAEWEGRSALEIGCGDGRLSGLLASLGCRLVSVDPDETQLEAARKSFPDLTFRRASGERLPFADHTFDLAIFTLSLHHQDAMQALLESARVVKPEGTILVLEPTGGSELERLCRLFHDESAVQEEARRVLRQVPCGGFEERSFRTEWCFESAEELVEGLFAYFHRDPDPKLRAAILALIGDRQGARPLSLTDELYLACLRMG